MAQKTQGSELYVLNPADNSVVKIECATGFTGLSSPRDQIDVGCLDSEDKEFLSGQRTPAQAQLTINEDMTFESHALLQTLYEDGTVTQWALGYSDGKDIVPTADSSGLVLPTTRSWRTFQGYVVDFPVDVALNDAYRSTIPVQISGPLLRIPKST